MSVQSTPYRTIYKNCINSRFHAFICCKMPPKHQFRAQTLIEQGAVKMATLSTLKTWCEQRPLPTLSDEQLVLFLLSCNNDLKATQTTVVAFFECKQNSPELFNNRRMDAEGIQRAIKCTEVAMLPCRTVDNSAVIFGRLKDTSYYNFHVEPEMKLFFMCVELGLYKSPPSGLIAVFDMKGFGLMHLTRFKLGAIQKFFRYLQEGLPCQLRAIHVLNAVYFFDKLMAILRPFMSAEVAKMIVLHKNGVDMEEFFGKCVEKRCMPKEYGGDLGNVGDLCEDVYESVRGMEEFFRLEEEQIGLYKKK